MEYFSDPHGHLWPRTPCPFSPEAHPWIPGRSDIHIPSVTHRIGTSQTFADNKKDKNHIAWGSAKLLFHPIRVLNCWKLKGFPLEREHSPARKSPERYRSNNSWRSALGNKRLDKGFFFWFVVDDVFKRCYSTDPGTWISIFTLFLPVMDSHVQNMLGMVYPSLVILFSYHSLKVLHPLGLKWMDITMWMDALSCSSRKQELSVLIPAAETASWGDHVWFKPRVKSCFRNLSWIWGAQGAPAQESHRKTPNTLVQSFNEAPSCCTWHCWVQAQEHRIPVGVPHPAWHLPRLLAVNPAKT